MGSFSVVLQKDLRRRLRSPLAPVILLLFPLFFSLLIGVTFGGSGEKLAAIRIALVDEDNGLASRLLQGAFNQQNSDQRFDVQTVDYDRGLRLVEANKVSALVRVPKGFTDSLLAAGPTSLEVVKNPAQSIYPNIVETYVEVLGQLGGSAVRLLGEPLREINRSRLSEISPSDLLVSQVATSINRRMKSIGRYVFPPLLRLEPKELAEGQTSASGGTEENASGTGRNAAEMGADTTAAGKGADAGKKSASSEPSRFGVAVLVLPGMAAYALLMLALISMADFQREGVHGTLSRQFTTPVPFSTVVLGKIAAVWILSLVCILILALVAAFWAPPGVSGGGFLALSLCFALFATGFGALIQSSSRSERTGSAIGSILVLIMSMAGGSFIPLESMPSFLRAIAPFSLIYWGTEGYRTLLSGSTRILPNLIVLLAVGTVCSALAAARFTRRYGTGG